MAAVVEVMSVVMIVCAVGGALIVSGAWLAERKYSADSSSANRSLGSADQEDDR